MPETTPIPALLTPPGRTEPARPSVARDWGIAMIAGGCAMALYVATLMPTVGFIDAPRYTAFVHRFHLGVASIEHPLYVLAAKPFASIPIGDLAYRVNLATAFFGAVAVALAALLILRGTGSRYAALVGALGFATSYDLWWLATEAEVYTLEIALLFASLLFVIGRPAGQPPAPARAVFFVGLATLNHQAALIALGPIVVYALSSLPAGERVRTLIRLGGAFAAGIAPYVLLFIGHTLAAGWAATAHAAAGGEFQSSFFAPIGVRGYARAVATLMIMTGYQFYPFHTAAWIAGSVHVARSDPRRAWLIAAIGVLNALVVLAYDVPDRIYFYLPSFAMLALFLGEGLAALERFTRKKRRSLRSAILIFMALPVCGKIVHYRLADDFVGRFMGGEEQLFGQIEAKASVRYPIILPRIPTRDNLGYYSNPDKSEVRASEHYRRVLESLPPGALIIDDWYHGYAIMADYYQGVESVRTDVEVLRWFERWGGTTEERELLAEHVLNEIDAGRSLFLATNQYPSSTLIGRIVAAGHRIEPWADVEELNRVVPRDKRP